MSAPRTDKREGLQVYWEKKLPPKKQLQSILLTFFHRWLFMRPTFLQPVSVVLSLRQSDNSQRCVFYNQSENNFPLVRLSLSLCRYLLQHSRMHTAPTYLPLEVRLLLKSKTFHIDLSTANQRVLALINCFSKHCTNDLHHFYRFTNIKTKKTAPLSWKGKQKTKKT